jgi:hypothetical protein
MAAMPALAVGQEAAPKAVVPEPSHVFAQVLEGVVVTHDFVIRNQGDAPLVIRKVSSD